MNSRNHEEKAHGPFPWKSIASSVSVYALLLAQCSQTFCYWMLATKSPEYSDKILKMDLTTIGTHTGLPYFTAFTFSMVVIWLNHMLVKNGTLTTRSSRMLWNGIRMVVPALCILVLGYTNTKNSVFAITLLYIGITSNITIYSGHHANHLDLSSKYAGLLMAVMNMWRLEIHPQSHDGRAVSRASR
ncbi:hypothetical protein TKK_0003727 [Trichogramma kaykai]